MLAAFSAPESWVPYIVVGLAVGGATIIGMTMSTSLTAVLLKIVSGFGAFAEIAMLARTIDPADPLVGLRVVLLGTIVVGLAAGFIGGAVLRIVLPWRGAGLRALPEAAFSALFVARAVILPMDDVGVIELTESVWLFLLAGLTCALLGVLAALPEVGYLGILSGCVTFAVLAAEIVVSGPEHSSIGLGGVLALCAFGAIVVLTVPFRRTRRSA
ncbi:hypothetical protein [Microbacterium karelineae]|uniref:hypothetical protein n=1 Tax=Microbacterium karelineae TaxID=2654283 RepID=UPI0012EA85C8|nr:hypothetical protein [Microbacterium karelineae]